MLVDDAAPGRPGSGGEPQRGASRGASTAGGAQSGAFGGTTMGSGGAVLGVGGLGVGAGGLTGGAGGVAMGGEGNTSGAGGEWGAGGGWGMGGAPWTEADAYCEEACANATMFPGNCVELYVCSGTSECRNRAEHWSSTARTAFEWCLNNQPLCFISAEGCMMDHLGIRKEVVHVITGTGFHLEDGTSVGISSGEGTQTLGTVQDGSFALSVEGSRTLDIGWSVWIWTDDSGDESCGPGDLLGSTTAVFNGDFEAPAFVAEVTPATLSPLSVDACENRF